MSIVKSIFKVLRSGTWDEHYFKTSSDQVVHTKTDGQASTVKEQLDGLNSALAGKAPSSHTHDDRYYTETEINTNLINTRDISSQYSNFDPSGKFNTPDNTNGWIRMLKNGKRLNFTAALGIKTNFGKNTNYRICTLPFTVPGTQYGFAVSQDTGTVLILHADANTNILYVQTKGVAPSTGDWLWMNIDLICNE